MASGPTRTKTEGRVITAQPRASPANEASRDDIGPLSELEELGEFQTRMVEEVGGQGMPAMHHPFDLFRQVEGIPLRTRQKESSGGTRETIFTNLGKADVPASTFDVPAGYTERQLLPPMPQG